MSATIKTLLMVLILSGIPGRSYALCTDQRHPSVQAEFKQSKYVVIATVKSYRYVGSPEDPEGYAATIYRVVVDRIFRGAPGAKMDIYSENTSARFPMGVGKKYLLFIKKGWDRDYVDSCGNSNLLAKSKNELSDVLELVGKK